MQHSLYTAILLLAPCALTARAQAPAPLNTRESLSLSAGVIGLHDDDDHRAAMSFEYRFANQGHGLQPLLGAAAFESGNFYLFTGLRYEWTLSERWYLAPSVSVGGFRDSGFDLGGSGVLFRTGGELGYRIDDHSNLGLSFFHISNAELHRDNPGADSLTLTYSVDLQRVLGRREPGPESPSGLLVGR